MCVPGNPNGALDLKNIRGLSSAPVSAPGVPSPARLPSSAPVLTPPSPAGGAEKVYPGKKDPGVIQEPSRPGDAPKNAPAPKSNGKDDGIEAFVKSVRPAAEKQAAKLGVPVDGIIAQWAYESGWGKSKLATEANNLGGVKTGGGWKGETYASPTKEKNGTQTENATFRKYGSVDAYAEDFGNLLQKPRYKNVGGASTPYDYALRLGQAGYHQDTPEKYAGEIDRISKRIKPYLKLG